MIFVSWQLKHDELKLSLLTWDLTYALFFNFLIHKSTKFWKKVYTALRENQEKTSKQHVCRNILPPSIKKYNYRDRVSQTSLSLTKFIVNNINITSPNKFSMKIYYITNLMDLFCLISVSIFSDNFSQSLNYLTP